MLREGGGTRPDVLAVNHFDRTVVLKDHNSSDRWFSRLIGPLLCYREVKALSQLAGVRGIPRLIEKVNRRALLMEHLDVVQLKHIEFDIDWSEFFGQLTDLIEQMHQQGVAHCDLRSPGNILVDIEGQPYLVDFVACVFRGQRWNFISRWIFVKFQGADRGAILKLKQRFAAELLDEEARLSMQKRGFLELTARAIGSNVRKLSRKLFADQK